MCKPGSLGSRGPRHRPRKAILQQSGILLLGTPSHCLLKLDFSVLLQGISLSVCLRIFMFSLFASGSAFFQWYIFLWLASVSYLPRRFRRGRKASLHFSSIEFLLVFFYHIAHTMSFLFRDELWISSRALSTEPLEGMASLTSPEHVHRIARSMVWWVSFTVRFTRESMCKSQIARQRSTKNAI